MAKMIVLSQDDKVFYRSTVGDSTEVSWSMVLHLLLWPQNTVLNKDSVVRVNEFLVGHPVLLEFLKLEVETYPIISKLQTTGIDICAEDWNLLVIGNKQSRLNRLSNAITTKESLDEFEKLSRFIHANFVNFQEFCPNVFKTNGRWYRTLRGQWEHYGTYSGRYKAIKLPMMALPKELRAFMEPSDANFTYIAADLSNVELRVAAALSNDVDLKKLFWSGSDVHLINGRRFSDTLGLELTDEIAHKLGKRVAFTILYGGGAHGIMESAEQATGLNLMNNWNAPLELRCEFTTMYPELKKLLTPKTENAFLTPWGEVPINVKLTTPQRINLPVQLTASVLFKRLLVACSKIPNVDVVLPVHDELYFKVPVGAIEEAKKLITHTIEHTLNTSWKDFPTTDIVRYSQLGGTHALRQN